MASRCVDFGLAMTTLVPYVDEQRDRDRIRVERKYRVSEANKGFPFEDMAAVYQAIGEETIAYCSHYLGEHSERFRNTDLPLEVATGLIAIMRPILEELKLPLGIEPGQPNPRIALRRKPEVVSPVDIESPFFKLEGAAIVPSPHFIERCDADELRIDRWSITQHVENFLDLMMPLLDDVPADQLDEVLSGWTLSSDHMLGLTHLQSAIKAALEVIDAPLKRILRGEEHQQTLGVVERVVVIGDSARTDLDTLSGDWASIAEACWPHHSKRVSSLLESGAPPADPGTLFELPRALLGAATTTSMLTARLDEISARVWKGEEAAGDGAAVAEISRSCAEMRRALASLDGDELPGRTAGDTRVTIVQASEELLALAATLIAFADAIAGSFCGPKGLRQIDEREREREKAILFMDLAGSFVHAIEHSPEENHAWKELALGCAAQWGRAFGGDEPRDREGDAIWLEFETVGAAVLCGAAIQMHAHALRSTKVPQLQWSLRMAVDFGWIRNGDGGNATGLALDLPATLAKKVKDDASIQRVLVTTAATERCSEHVHREPLIHLLGERVELASVDAPEASMEPWSVDTPVVLAELSSHIEAIAAKLASGFEASGDDETMAVVDLAPREDELLGEATSS